MPEQQKPAEVIPTVEVVSPILFGAYHRFACEGGGVREELHATVAAG